MEWKAHCGAPFFSDDRMRRNHHRTLIVLCAALLAMIAERAPAQLFPGRMSVLVHGTLTTATNLFLRPDAETPEQRLESEPYNRLLGGGIEVRIPVLGGDFYLSASAGYSARVDSRTRAFAFPDTLLLLPVDEGVRFIPVELGLNAVIPLSSETVRMSMGAGIGAYYLARVVRVAGHNAAVDNLPVDVNIFVDIAFEYRLTPDLALQGQGI